MANLKLRIKEDKKPCEYCGQKPVFLDGKYYDRNLSSKEFVCSNYEAAHIGADEKGTIVMWVCGDDISENIPLNFCPVCGRNLRRNKDK